MKSRRVASCSCVPNTLSRRMRPCSSAARVRRCPRPRRAAAVGGHLDRLAPAHDVHEPKAAADDARAAEERAHLLGRRARRDVEILGLPAEHQIAHRAADDERGEVVLLQRVCVVRSAHALMRSRAMPCASNGTIFGCRGFEQAAGENLAEKLGDHSLGALHSSSARGDRKVAASCIRFGTTGAPSVQRLEIIHPARTSALRRARTSRSLQPYACSRRSRVSTSSAGPGSQRCRRRRRRARACKRARSTAARAGP